MIVPDQANKRWLALPVPGTNVIAARKYGMSLWGQTARIDTTLPNGVPKTYFLKVISPPTVYL